VLSDERKRRFNRQLRLPEIGPAGQALLSGSRVAVVGCGGLGAPVIQYLAAMGVGHLTLFDDDTVELSNLNRQVLHRHEDIGRPKAERAAEWVRALDPELSVEARRERVSVHNARDIAADHHLVMDCSDGLPVKYLLNDAAVLEDTPLVHGAVTGLAGQVLVVRRGGRPCLRCLFEEVPPPETVPSCQQVGVLGAACGIVGSLMALQAAKLLAGFGRDFGPDLEGRFLSVDLFGVRLQDFRFTAREDCPVCGSRPEIDARTLDDYEADR